MPSANAERQALWRHRRNWLAKQAVVRERRIAKLESQRNKLAKQVLAKERRIAELERLLVEHKIIPPGDRGKSARPKGLKLRNDKDRAMDQLAERGRSAAAKTSGAW